MKEKFVHFVDQMRRANKTYQYNFSMQSSPPQLYSKGKGRRGKEEKRKEEEEKMKRLKHTSVATSYNNILSMQIYSFHNLFCCTKISKF